MKLIRLGGINKSISWRIKMIGEQEIMFGKIKSG